MSVSVGEGSAEMDKSGAVPVAANAQAPDEPVLGSAEKTAEIEEEEQRVDSEVRPGAEESNGVEEMEVGTEEVGMPEAPVEHSFLRAKFLRTYFILVIVNSQQTLQQQGYYIKEKVNELIQGQGLTAGPIEIHVADKEVRVSVVMRSRRDIRVLGIVDALELIGIMTTSGEMEDMSSGFIVAKEFARQGIARFIHNNMPPHTVVIIVDISCFKGSGGTSLKGKVMVGTDLTVRQTHQWAAALVAARSGQEANVIQANMADRSVNVSKAHALLAGASRGSTTILLSDALEILRQYTFVIAGQPEKEFADGGRMVGPMRDEVHLMQLDNFVVDGKAYKNTSPGILEITASGPAIHASVFANILTLLVERQLQYDTEGKGLYVKTDMRDDQGKVISAYFDTDHVELRKGTDQPTLEEAKVAQQKFFEKKDAVTLAKAGGNIAMAKASGGGIDMAQVKAMMNERADKDLVKKKEEEAAALVAMEAFRRASKEEAEVRCADEAKARKVDAEDTASKFNFLTNALAGLVATNEQAAKQAAENKKDTDRIVGQQITAATNLNNHLSAVFEARAQPTIQIKESDVKGDDSDCSDVGDEAVRAQARAAMEATKKEEAAAAAQKEESMAAEEHERKSELEAAAATAVASYSGEQGGGGPSDAKDDEVEMDESVTGFVNAHKNPREGDGTEDPKESKGAARKAAKAVKWPPVGDKGVQGGM